MKKIKKVVAAVKKVGTLNLVLILVGAFFSLVQLADDPGFPGIWKYAGNLCLRCCGSNNR